jgi:hypothetical protein
MMVPKASRAQLVAALDRADRSAVLVAEAALATDRTRKIALVREALRLATAATVLISDVQKSPASNGGRAVARRVA